MEFNKYKVVDELYEKYSFVTNKKYLLAKIVYKSLDKATSYEEAIKIGEKNIRDDILFRMSNGLFTKLFYRTVDKLGLEDTYNFYDKFLKDTCMVLSDYDLILMSKKEEYSKFYEEADPGNNKLLEDVIVLYNSDVNVELYSDSIFTAETRAYLHSIHGCKALTGEVEQELFKKYRETNDEEYKDAIIKGNLKLVVHIAKRRYAAMLNSGLKLDLLDFIQAGNLGLLIAFDKYDETLGIRFSTYASRGIKNQINALICSENKTIRIPEKAVYLTSFIKKYKEDYLQKYHVEPSKEQIMVHFDLDEDTYNKIVVANSRKVESYDVPVETDLFDEEDLGYTVFKKDMIVDNDSESIEDVTIEKYYVEELLAYAKRTLDPIKYKVLLESCGFNKSETARGVTSIGRELHLSAERARQLRVAAIQLLQANSDPVNYGVSISQEYYSTKDVKRILEEKHIYQFRVLRHAPYVKSTSIKCCECGETFNQDIKEFLKKFECPNCGRVKKLPPLNMLEEQLRAKVLYLRNGHKNTN
jgi:RNA polymerase sigma factor (sigma-70 family)